ncbi:MAG: class I SAM-dependent DNA methyltransferase [Sarcina sp.]
MDSYNKMAKVYDELINEDINYEEISKFLIELAEKEKISFDNYLDLACGTGNVGILVGAYFKENYFVDLSYDMLMEADRKIRASKVKGKVICQDMTELNLLKTFDLISCVLDSTNYILDEEELEDYFKSVYEHLNEDGIFVFDINSYYKLSEVLGNNIYTYDSEDIFYSWENIFEDEIVEMTLNFFIRDGEIYERFTEVHEERAYKEEFIEKIFKKVGFKEILKTDGYSYNEVTEKTERILYVLKK